jgi:hypothetical protein
VWLIDVQPLLGGEKMKRIAIAVMVLGLIVGCQKTDTAKETAETATTQQADSPTPVGPPMRPSDARLAIESVTLAAGQSGSFKINYYGVEPVKAMVVPLKTTEGMHVDSISWAGSMVEYLANKPTRVDTATQLLLLAAVPVTEPLIPADSGLFATIYFTLGPNAQSGMITETFAPPANHLSYVDTAKTLAQPYFEGGQVTVQ